MSKLDVADVILFGGLALIVAGVACFDWRIALIVAGVFLVALAIIRGATHAE